MSGSKIGGLKAAAKNKSKDPDFYRKIGAKGGKGGTTGGFYARRDLASKYGKIGGAISRKRPKDREAAK